MRYEHVALVALTATLNLAPAAVRAQEPWEAGGSALSWMQRNMPASPPVATPQGAAVPQNGAYRGDQFLGGPRDQGQVGSCHIFASVALLEAAFFRRIGTRIRLSEADLFLHARVFSGRIYEDFLGSGDFTLSEGAWPEETIAHALRHGVSLGGDYEEFYRRWELYVNLHRVAGAGALLSRMTPLAMVPLADPRVLLSGTARSREYRAMLRDYFQREEPRQAEERRMVATTLAGATQSTIWFNSTEYEPGESCRLRGGTAGRAIRAELDAGRPVAVAMDLTDLPAWRARAGTAVRFALDEIGRPKLVSHTGRPSHAFVIEGYRFERGLLTLQTRNSWGPGATMNPDIPSDQLCRVFSMTSVFNPGERPSFQTAE